MASHGVFCKFINMTAKESSFFRILIIEDDPYRIQRLKSWLPDDVKTVRATSAGRAIGVLQRDKGNLNCDLIKDLGLQKCIWQYNPRYPRYIPRIINTSMMCALKW